MERASFPENVRLPFSREEIFFSERFEPTLFLGLESSPHIHMSQARPRSLQLGLAPRLQRPILPAELKAFLIYSQGQGQVAKKKAFRTGAALTWHERCQQHVSQPASQPVQSLICELLLMLRDSWRESSYRTGLERSWLRHWDEDQVFKQLIKLDELLF